MEPVKAGLRMLSLMLRMKEEDRTEWQVPLQAEKGKGIALPLEPTEGATPIETLIIAWGNSLQISECQNGKIISMCCITPLLVVICCRINRKLTIT